MVQKSEIAVNIGQLLQSDAIFNELFRKNPSNKLLIDADNGDIIDANLAALRFYGYSHEEITGMNIRDINTLPPDEVTNRLSDARKQHMAKYDFKHRTADGYIKDVEVNTALVMLKGKEFYYSVITDITDILISQERLRYGELLFLQFVTKTPVALAMFDNDMNYLMISERWAQDFQMQPDECIGKNYYELFKNQPKHWEEAHKKALSGSHERFEQDVLVRPDGSIDWIRWEVLNWFKENDEIGGVIIYKEIITQRKKAEEVSNRLIEQRSRMAVKMETIEEERMNISRELHDGLGQLLTAAHLNLVLIEQNLKENPGQVLADLKRTKNIITNTIQEVRSISQNLRPVILDDLGLVPALRTLCDEFSQSTTLTVRFEEYQITGPHRAGIEIAIYRICQEALNNIARHSDATEATVEIYNRSSHLLLLIQDNGRGFDVNQMMKTKSGSGLINIKERAELVGGSIQIESQIGLGTEIIVEIPLNENISFSNYE